jgi:hypothetical protein
LRVEIDERLKNQASDLLLDRRRIGSEKKRIEGPRVGGEIEAKGRSRFAAQPWCATSREDKRRE